MLGKLITYDIRSTRREFLGIFGVIAFSAVIMGLMGAYYSDNLHEGLGDSLIQVLFSITFFGLFVASVVIAIMTIINMYNKKVFGNEGYLTMTLPVQPWQVLSSKLITSAIWIALTGIVFFVSYAIVAMLLMLFLGEFSDFAQGFQVLTEIGFWGPGSISFYIIGFFASLVQALNTIMLIYLACSIANLGKLKKHKMLFGIGAFIIITIIESYFATAFAELFQGFIQDSFDQGIFQGITITSGQYLPNMNALFNGITPALGLSIAINAVLIGIKFAINTWILNKHLEID